MTRMMVLLMGLCLLIGSGLANADLILYQNDFSGGTEGASISAEGWSNAAKIVYSSGTAFRVAGGTAYPDGDSEGLQSELAFSHILAPGETVTLTADLWGGGNADVAIGLRTTNHQYKAIMRVPANVSLSAIDSVGVQANSDCYFNFHQLYSYRITLSQNSVSWYMKAWWDTSWTSLGTSAVTETEITHIILGNTFTDGTNQWGSDFKWDNIVLTSSVPEPATIGLLMLGGMLLRRKRK